jgi:uncharacterized membrane protein
MTVLKQRPEATPNFKARAFIRMKKLACDKHNLILIGIIEAGAFFRLWNLSHLFNAIFDSDQGVYSLAARFISQGYLPYRDFTLAHPPLHTLMLSGIYEVFGYNFIYGQYLSVMLSLASIILIYTIGKKLYHPAAGLVASAIFAVSPEMVYLGRRVVQEPLGIFLVLIAVLLAVDFIKHNNPKHFLLCGFFLGLAVATKYTFIPAAVAIIGALLTLNLGERFTGTVRNLGKGAFWINYICLAAIIFSVLLVLRLMFGMPVSVPFIDAVHWSWPNFLTVVILFIIPFFIAVMRTRGSTSVKDWWYALRAMPNKKTFGQLILGTLMGFFGVTAFFVARMPHEFIYQTVLMQQTRPLVEIPSFVMIRVAFYAVGFSKMSFISILLSLPMAILILRKHNFSRSDAFLAISIMLALLFAQDFICLPRYYIAPVLFFTLGVASLTPVIDASIFRFRLLDTMVKNRVITLFTLCLLFSSLTAVLLKDYIGYDIANPFTAPDTEKVYQATAEYLRSVGAKKVYAVNPIYLALAPDLTSTLDTDSYGLLWLAGIPAEQLIKEKIFEGVDYVVIDAWVRWWNDSTEQQLIQAVEKFGQVATVIEPNSTVSTVIYSFSGKAEESQVEAEE